MSKPTLLSIVQEISKEINSGNINSIDDTTDASDIADIVIATYRDMMSSRDWKHTGRLIQFEASGTTSLPSHMTIPDNVKEVIPNSVKYNKIKSGETRKKYQSVRWKEPDDFLRFINSRDHTQSTVDIITDTSGIELLIYNDRAPEYYTSFDDVTVVFDSYDSAVDSTLQKSKTQVRAYIILSLVKADASIPDLPIEAFPALVQEAKSRASLAIKQAENPKAEQQSIKQGRILSRKQWTIGGGGIITADFGRKSGRYRDPTFRS